MNVKKIIALCFVLLAGCPFYLAAWTSEEPVSFCWFCTGMIMVIQFTVGCTLLAALSDD